MTANRKKIDRRKIAGQLGINRIEHIVLQMGYAWHPSNSELDAGIDGIIEICQPDTGEATNNIIQVQSKVLSDLTAETASSFHYVCKERDLDYWLSGNAPVILVIIRRDSEEAYWVSVKDHFRDQARRSSCCVYFDKARDRFEPSSAHRLRDLAVPL
ncbi:MAG: DUF4365 domain-containing protein, partial [bacterium]